MAATTSWNYQDTSATAVGNLTPATLSYATDWAKTVAVAKEARLTNLTTPLDRKEYARFAYDKVSNVYKGSDISPAYYAQNKTGSSVLVQLNTVLSYTDDSGARTDLPLSAHLVIRVPNHVAITGSILTTLLGRLVGLCYEQSDTSANARLNALVRGGLLPAALA